MATAPRPPVRRRDPLAGFDPAERAVFDSLRSLDDVQGFLDALAYDPAPGARSPRVTLRTRQAHCFGGALLAAAALRRFGHPPLLVDLRAVNDDDHVLAVFRRRGFWGALGKSNCTTLRLREPIYRTLRELALSYFELYVNTLGQKTLRDYSVTLDLRRWDAEGWMFDEQPLDRIEEKLESIRHYRLLDRRQERELTLASPAVLEAVMLGSDPAGLYVPKG
ncbi:MAG TPA: hypothetical protein VMV46_08635 [Thermoanaerobaculia bacterium]|nr:hypothetical protein [Thermoanaerobaculia bacterium]